jgi:hypothetical protein
MSSLIVTPPLRSISAIACAILLPACGVLGVLADGVLLVLFRLGAAALAAVAFFFALPLAGTPWALGLARGSGSAPQFGDALPDLAVAAEEVICKTAAEFSDYGRPGGSVESANIKQEPPMKGKTKPSPPEARSSLPLVGPATAAADRRHWASFT